MNDWRDSWRPDDYYSKISNSKDINYIAYKNSTSNRINMRFDRFIKKIGGRGRAFLLLFIGFAIPISAIAFFLHWIQQRLQFSIGSFLMCFYENHIPAYVYVLTIIGGLVVWFFCLIGIFFRENLHEFNRPRRRVWAAELEDARLGLLDGKISAVSLIICFVVVTILAAVIMVVFPGCLCFFLGRV